jgi:putative oxidoreductase
MGLDVGLLVIRLLVGGLLVGHGLQKLTGRLRGDGLEGTAGFFAQLGYPSPRATAAAAGLTEVGVGALFAVGFALPLAAAGLIGVMLNAAIAVHAANGLWVQHGGYEYPLVLGGLGLALALSGPGRYALTAGVGVEVAGLAAGGVAALAGVGGGLAALALRRRPAHA